MNDNITTLAHAAKRGAIAISGDELMTVSDVMREARLGKTKAYKLMNSGELPYLQFNGFRRIRRSDFQAWIQRGLVAAQAQAEARAQAVIQL